jgi:hypothetical protein
MLGISVIALAIVGVLNSVQIYKILADLRSITQNVSKTAADLAAIKEGIKVGVMTFGKKIMEKSKGGEQDDSQKT